MTMSTAATTQTQPAPPPVDKIKVRVNGKEVEVPRTMPDPVTGKPVPTTMIQACVAAGVDGAALLLSSRSCRSPAIAACAWSSSARRRSARTASRS